MFYGAQTLTLNRNKYVENTQKKERQTFMNILGPKHIDELLKHRLDSNKTIDEYTYIRSDQ